MVKTITIRDDVYEELAKLKKDRESFSEVILRILKGKKINLLNFYGIFNDKELWLNIEREIMKERKKAVIRRNC
ncbi:MAG: antitoxin VapB family protein [Candidatus Bathyarchaeia archaeon]